jgi:Zn-dependent protease with chaperone function
VFCPKCGVKSPEGALYCYRCGGLLPADAGASPSPEAKPPDATAQPARARELVYPRSLRAEQYAHPLDRRSLEAISKFAPVVAVTRAIMQHWDEPMVKGQLLGGTVKVGPAQFPEVHGIVVRCAAVLNMEAPEVFIRHSPTFNAMTLGAARPLIILHSSLVESFEREELAYIIGHEMGHIKSEHSLYLSAAYMLAMGARGLVDRLFGLGSLLIRPAMQALQAWMRKAELTADRAGLLCVQDLGLARRALIKLAVGSRTLFDRLDVDEYLRQADEASRDGFGRMGEMMQTHPHIANRVRELRYFAESPVYNSLLGTGPAPSAAEMDVLAHDGLERGRGQLAEVATIAGLLSARSRLERALAEFDLVLARYPGTEAARQALYYKGYAHLNLRQGLEAAKAFWSFVARNPVHELGADALWGLAHTYERLLNDKDAAVVEYRRLLTEYPESPRAEGARDALKRLGAPAGTGDEGEGDVPAEPEG